MTEDILKQFDEHKKAIDLTINLIPTIQKISNTIVDTINNGGKILIFGNGGSAADSQHFAAELTARFEKERRGLPAIALTTDTSFLTAWSNDYNFETIFSRQIEALATKNDLVIGFSTSGNSKNVIEAMKKSRELSVKTVLFLGRDGGELANSADYELIIPHENTARIQEAHLLCYHIICKEVEKQIN